MLLSFFICFLSCLFPSCLFFVVFLCGNEAYGNWFARCLFWVLVCIATEKILNSPHNFIGFCHFMVWFHCLLEPTTFWEKTSICVFPFSILFSSVGSCACCWLSYFFWWWFVSGLRVTLVLTILVLVFSFCWLLCCSLVLLSVHVVVGGQKNKKTLTNKKETKKINKTHKLKKSNTQHNNNNKKYD